MRSWKRKLLYASALFLLIIQFFPPNRTNPSTDISRSIHASVTMEPAVASALARACNDCHSNLTVWPWYSQVAPASWLVASDVDRGRRVLNFSDWKALSPEKQQEVLPEICKEVSDRDMPPDQYVIIHPTARLNRVEINSICTWVHSVALVGSEQAESENVTP